MTSQLLYLSRAAVESLQISISAVVEAVEAGFLEKGRGGVEMPPKPGIHPGNDAFIHAMPAYVPNLNAAGLKWVSGFPNNHLRGLPYISGLFILNDSETGLPLMVCDCTWLTAKRTAAASAVAAKYLARSDARRLSLLGCGVQGTSHLEAFVATQPQLQEVLIYDPRPEAMEQITDYARKLAPALRIVREDLETTVRKGDIVITSGPILKNPTAPIPSDWLAPGAFACPVDFDSYFSGAALAGADILVTDDLGQLEYYRSVGYFSDTPVPAADLGHVVADGRARRTNDQQRTIALNLGLALEDVVVAQIIYREAQRQQVGIALPL